MAGLNITLDILSRAAAILLIVSGLVGMYDPIFCE